MEQQASSQKGFTLLELSIVLVIIGLIVGGILVGQDLIKAAELRATIAQVDKYNSAVNTFRVKFNGIPGDFLQTYAGSFGLFQLTNAAILGQGDGSGFIEGGASGGTAPIGETLAFWRHLSDASLVDGQFGSVGNSAIVAATGVVTATVTTVSQSLPVTKLTPAGYFVVYSAAGVNYFQILPIASVTTTPSYTFGNAGLTPIQAYDVDIKVDDGLPNTGSVVARAINTVNGAPSVNAASQNNTCTIGSGITSDTYNRVANPNTGGNDPSCSLRFRFN